jgi:succinyl-diaminopimelate desuccinylase
MDDIGLLAELVSINSVFPNEVRIGEYVEKKLEGMGFSVYRQQVEGERFNVLAERGSGNAPLLYAHLDTVPAYGEWQGNPLELREEDGRLYGLGAYDIKSGVAAILSACAATDGRVKVAFGVDEENNSAGANLLRNSDFISDVEGVLAAEILDVPEASPNCVMLGRRGRCVLELDVPGKSAHGGHAGMGVNAIGEAARLVQKLEGMELPEHDLLPRPNQFIRKIYSESTSLSVPDSAIVEIDRHLVVPENPESACRHVQEFVDSLYDNGDFTDMGGRRITARVKPRDVPYLMPYVTPQDNKFAQRVSSVVENPRYVYGATVADENVFSATGLPIVTLGPVGGNEHSANEWVSKESYLRLIEHLKAFIQQS